MAEQYDEEIEIYILQHEQLTKAAKKDADKLARLQAKCEEIQEFQTSVSKMPFEIKAEPKEPQIDFTQFMEMSVLNVTNK